jgi:hypothetical protein
VSGIAEQNLRGKSIQRGGPFVNLNVKMSPCCKDDRANNALIKGGNKGFGPTRRNGYATCYAAQVHDCAINAKKFPCKNGHKGDLKVCFVPLIEPSRVDMLPLRRLPGVLRRYGVVDRVRWASTAEAPPYKDKFKVLVIGGGASFFRLVLPSN